MIKPVPSSFKDPDARVVFYQGQPYRIIYNSYKEHYNRLISSGFSSLLKEKHLLIPDDEVVLTELSDRFGPNVFKIIKPQPLDFLSFPYEWSFRHFKKAAILTLQIQLRALEHGMSLKDATAYNVQFIGVRPIFIDTSSFELYTDDQPWAAYGQFCRHFLGPLLLFQCNKHELIKLSQSYIDGIPLKVVSEALPYKSKFNFFTFSHIHYHAKLELAYSNDLSFKAKKLKMSKNRLFLFLQHLKQRIEGMEMRKVKTEWSDYYQNFSYSVGSFNDKKNLIHDFLKEKKVKTLLDLGCNEGEFSLLAAELVEQVVAADLDHAVINTLFEQIEQKGKKNIHPMILDITNPSAAIGWMNTERESFLKRKQYDVVMALALIHHLAIGSNLPFENIANCFKLLCNKLIIEFVPKDDVQTQRLLITKKDVFQDYTEEEFKRVFSKYFTIKASHKVKDSGRVLYFMDKNA